MTFPILKYGSPLIPYRKDEKWGYYKLYEKIIIDCIYDDANQFINNNALIKLNSKLGVINEIGNEIIHCQFDEIKFTGNLIQVCMERKWGVFYKSGKEIISFICDNIYTSKGNYLIVVSNEKYGVIDQSGNIVVPCQYDQIGMCNEGMIPVAYFDSERYDELLRMYGGDDIFFVGIWGFVNYIGELIVKCIFSDVKEFSEGLAPVALDDNLWGFIDRTGKTIISFEYENALSFSEGVAAVKLNGKWSFIDKLGKEIISFKYDIVESFVGGIAKVGIGEFVYTDYETKFIGKYGIIDKSGNEIVYCKYDIIEHSPSNIYLVGIGKWFQEGGYSNYIFDGKYGYLDENGKEIIPLIYDYACAFKNGKAIVGFGKKIFHSYSINNFKGKFGLIDLDGHQIIDFKYDKLNMHSDEFARYELGIWEEYSKGLDFFTTISSGLINKEGQEITSHLYSHARNFKEGRAAVCLNDKWGFIDNVYYRLIIQCKYDSVSDFFMDLAKVELNGRSFYINKDGVEYYE